MSGVAIQLSLEGMDAVQERLSGLMLTDAQIRPLLSDIGEEVVSQTHQHFEAGESPAGEKWEASIRAEAEGGQTLVDTARLQNSMGYEVSGGQVEAGTNVIYAAIHNFGGEDVGKPEILMRQFLPKSKDEISGFDLMVDAFIMKALQ